MRISELKFSLLGPETRKESDASARAMHQQAAQRKARYATTERNNMFKSLKRRVALGAVAAVGAAGLVTIAAPAANAAAISSFTVAVYPQRAVTGSASSITALVTTAGAETGTIRGIITSAPTPATADSVTQVVAGDTLTAYAVDWSAQAAGVAFAAATQSGGTAKSFNTAGTYGVNWFFDRNANNLIDADEPFLVSSFAIGGFQLFKTEIYKNTGGYNPEHVFAEDYYVSNKIHSKFFTLLNTKGVYTSSRRFRKKGLFYMITLMFKCWMNRNDESFYRKSHGYWD